MRKFLVTTAILAVLWPAALIGLLSSAHATEYEFNAMGPADYTVCGYVPGIYCILAR